MAATLRELEKWPERAEDVTVDAILRSVGVDTQFVYLEKWRAMDSDREYHKRPEHILRVQLVIAGVGFLACLRKLREVNPDAAQAFALDYWRMCDAGDSFGELLWQFITEAGLDPELIQLPAESSDEAQDASR